MQEQTTAEEAALAGRGYVLATAAYNEERHIGHTLRSVAHQTLRPRRWVIVSDGSTDRTDEIVRSFANSHPFIELLRISSSSLTTSPDCWPISRMSLDWASRGATSCK